MKRNQFWLWLLLLPPLLQSCEKKYPNAETIIQGKIVDENDNPMEGVAFVFSGINKTSLLNSTGTFYQTTKSDKNGEFTISQIIPKKTDYIDLNFTGSQPQYRNYIFTNSTLKAYIPDAISNYITIGKTNNLKFQIKKP